MATHAGEPLGEALARLGIAPELDVGALADALWPGSRSMCATGPVRAWLASVVEEFFEGLPDGLELSA